MAESPFSIAVAGAGAVGCYFGGMLARSGVPVTLIGRPAHVEAIRRDGLFIDSLRFKEAIPILVSADVAAIRGARVVLLCVKTFDTESAARALQPHLSKDAVVVSLQNGVDNAARIRSAAGIEAVPAVVYVAAQMTGPGRVKHNGRGDLILGAPSSRREPIDRLAAMFTAAAVPCRISENIEGELWTKMVINCAYNAISALGRSEYGPIVRHAEARAVMIAAIEEALTVGRAAGVTFPDSHLVETALKLAEAMEHATSSTAQDLARGKRTEIDALNGYIARLGTELNVPTPVNTTLHALVKLLENASQAQPITGTV